jgi:integrase
MFLEPGRLLKPPFFLPHVLIYSLTIMEDYGNNWGGLSGQGSCIAVTYSSKSDLQQSAEMIVPAKTEDAMLENVGERLVVKQNANLPQRRKSAVRETIDERLIRAIHSAAPTDLAPTSEIGFSTSLSAMADNSKAAIAADLSCYTEWCAIERRAGLPANPEDLVRYLQVLDQKGRKPATLARRVASLGTVHRLLGLGDGNALPTNAPMVRAALKGVRRRKGAAQRQAAPLRLGQELDPLADKGFTLGALLAACDVDLQGLRDAALLSLGYDAGLRVSELVAVEEAHIEPQSDGSATLFIPRSKTDQEQQGAWAWLSPDTMRRVGAWLEASGLKAGPIFRRVGIDRRRASDASKPVAFELAPVNIRNWRQQMDGRPAEPARTTYSIGQAPLTRQGVNLIYRRVAMTAFDRGLTNLKAKDVFEAVRRLSSHSLRVGLTQDLFAAGEDGVGIAQALRWNSPTTALRYGRKLAVRSNVAARVLSRVRS